MRWFRRRNRDFINDRVHVVGSTMDPRWIPPSGALFAPHPHDAYQVTCLGCGAVTYHPQSCEAGKLWLHTEQEEEPTADPADCYCCSGSQRQGFHCRHCHAKGYCG